MSYNTIVDKVVCCNDKGVTLMTDQEIEKLVAEKLDEAFKSETHPNKFFLTENGRGVVDGGDMYNALLKDVLAVSNKAIAEILKAALKK